MIVPFVTLHVSAISALTAVTTALTLHVAPGVEIHLYEVLTWAEAPHRWRIYQLVLQTMVTLPSNYPKIFVTCMRAATPVERLD